MGGAADVGQETATRPGIRASGPLVADAVPGVGTGTTLTRGNAQSILVVSSSPPCYLVYDTGRFGNLPVAAGSDRFRVLQRSDGHRAGVRWDAIHAGIRTHSLQSGTGRRQPMDYALPSAARRIVHGLKVATQPVSRHPTGQRRPDDADQGARDALDLEAMRRIQTGHPAALGELMHRNWSPLMRYALTFLSETDAAEDVVQETFVRLWEKRRDWKPVGPLRSYLYRIARNLSLQEQKKRRVRKRWREAQTGQEPLELSPADEAEAGALRSALERAVSALPPRKREVVILTRFHGLTHEETAEVMGISAQTVANQLSMALIELRRILAAYRER